MICRRDAIVMQAILFDQLLFARDLFRLDMMRQNSLLVAVEFRHRHDLVPDAAQAGAFILQRRLMRLADIAQSRAPYQLTASPLMKP